MANRYTVVTVRRSGRVTHCSIFASNTEAHAFAQRTIDEAPAADRVSTSLFSDPSLPECLAVVSEAFNV